MGHRDVRENLRSKLAQAADAAFDNPEFQAPTLSLKPGADWQADMPVRLARDIKIFKLIEAGQ